VADLGNRSCLLTNSVVLVSRPLPLPARPVFAFLEFLEELLCSRIGHLACKIGDVVLSHLSFTSSAQQDEGFFSSPGTHRISAGLHQLAHFSFPWKRASGEASRCSYLRYGIRCEKYAFFTGPCSRRHTREVCLIGHAITKDRAFHGPCPMSPFSGQGKDLASGSSRTWSSPLSHPPP